MSPRPRIAPALVVCASVALITSLIVLPGQLTWGSSTSSFSFKAAVALAAARAGQIPGGPWNLISAAAIDQPGAFQDLALASFTFACPARGVVVNGWPVGTAHVAKGEFGTWVLQFGNSSGTVAVVEVSNIGTFVDAVYPTSPLCLSAPGLPPPLGAMVEDSTSFAADVSPLVEVAGAAYPGMASSLSLGWTPDFRGPFPVGWLGPFWRLGETPCAVSYPAPFEIPQFLAFQNATGPSPPVLASAVGGACAAGAFPLDLRSAMALRATAATGPVGGRYIYNFTVSSVRDPPGLWQIHPVLSWANGSNASGSTSLAVLTPSGSPIGSYNFSTGTWAPGAGAFVAPGESWSVTSRIDLSGVGATLELVPSPNTPYVEQVAEPIG